MYNEEHKMIDDKLLEKSVRLLKKSSIDKKEKDFFLNLLEETGKIAKSEQEYLSRNKDDEHKLNKHIESLYNHIKYLITKERKG